MKDLKGISLLLLMLITYGAGAIDFSRVNIAWQYDPLSELEVRHRIVQNGNLFTVFLRLRTDSISEWTYEFWKQDRYESEVHSSFESFQMDTLEDKSSSRVLKLSFQKPDENLLVLKISKKESFYYYDISLRNTPYPSIYPEDENGLPIFENYLSYSTFKWVGSDQFHALAYEERFELADPPMADMKPLAPGILPDSSFVFSNPVTLKDDFFYVIRSDSDAVSGVTMLKALPYYPEFKKLDELVPPMYYLLNEPEKKGVEASRNLKQSFDSFWLKTYATKFRARNAIRNYYNWVEQANKMFTDFKQGWKTDRGMAFIIFGGPDEVYRSENNEEWFYDDGPSFEFTVISTLFAPRTYALRRKIEFEETWFKYIGAIRRGSNE